MLMHNFSIKCSYTEAAWHRETVLITQYTGHLLCALHSGRGQTPQLKHQIPSMQSSQPPARLASPQMKKWGGRCEVSPPAAQLLGWDKGPHGSLPSHSPKGAKGHGDVVSPSPHSPLRETLKLLSPTKTFTHRKTLTMKLDVANKRTPKPARNFKCRRGRRTSRIWTL